MSPNFTSRVKANWTKAIRRIRSNGDETAATLAIVVLIAASLACVSGGDKAPTDSVFGTTDAVIVGQVGLGGALSLDVASAKAVLASARVATDRGEYSTTSNASGSFSLPVAGDKTYNLYVSANGYKTVIMQGIRVGSGQSRTVNLTITSTLAANERTYMGSSQCKLCHATQYNRWASSPHRYGISAPGDSPGILPAVRSLYESSSDLVNQSAFASYGSNAPKLSKTGDTYLVTIGSVSYPVTYAMGYQWKQRYLTKIGMAHYILPIQYNTATGGWVTYNASNWYTGTTPLYSATNSIESDIYKKNSWERKCMGCHSVTGIQSLKYAASSATGIEQHQAEWVEKGIGCEACHGPGSAHVWANGSLGPSSDPYIINPSKLSVSQRNDVCGQCHSRGLSIAKLYGQAADTYNVTSDTFTLEYFFNGTRTFRPGDTLTTYYTDGGGYWDTRYAEVHTSKQHHQQWNDFKQSGHTAPGAATEVTCASCHDVHGPVGSPRQLKLSADDNALCLSCHGPDGAANQRFTTNAAVLDHMPSTHTSYDPSGTGAGKCITCHMPFTAKSALNYDVRSHTFRIVRPHNTRRFYNAAASETMPNSCNQSCHNSSSSLGTTFGVGTAGALAAAEAYDSYVQNPQNKTVDGSTALITGTVFVTGASTLDDTAGVWVTVDNTASKGVVTGPDGKYAILVDSPGVYFLTAMKAGHDSRQLEVTVGSDSAQTQIGKNMVIPTKGGDSALVRPLRCMSCHGATYGAQWRNSGFSNLLASQTSETYIFNGHSGHGGKLGRNWSSTSCQWCHEAQGSQRYLTTGDTTLTYTTRPAQSQEQATCMVCHKPHTSVAAPNHALRQYKTSNFNYAYFFDSAYVTSGYGAGAKVAEYASMPFPASYEAATCLHCHNSRKAYGPLQDGTGAGIKTSGSDSVWATDRPHYGVTSAAFFGYVDSAGLVGIQPSRTFRDTFTMARVTFDSLAYGVDTNASGVVIDTPQVSAHADSFGQLLTFQSYVYSNGQPKLVYRNNAPLMKTNVRFTCVTCHMYSQKDGTYGSGSKSEEDAGHTWKLDMRACGVCHDANYTGNTTNPVRSTSSTSNGFGTSWGISRSTGKMLGDDPPAKADYDGNGTTESYKLEIQGLYHRVMASLTVGTGDANSGNLTSGIGTAGTDSAGHTFASNTFKYNAAKAKAGLVTLDEQRAVWNLYFFLRGEDLNTLGHHNSRFEVMLLRNTWRVLGRHITGQSKWNPPGSDWS